MTLPFDPDPEWPRNPHIQIRHTQKPPKPYLVQLSRLTKSWDTTWLKLTWWTRLNLPILLKVSPSSKDVYGADAYVTYHVSPLGVERGRLEIALLPWLQVICGTRSPSVSGILLEKMLCFLRINLTRPWLSTRIFLGVVSLDTQQK